MKSSVESLRELVSTMETEEVNIQSFLKIVSWKTRNRDFAQTHDLFVCQSACFDLSELKLQVEDGGVVPDVSELVYQLPAAGRRGDECVVLK